VLGAEAVRHELVEHLARVGVVVRPLLGMAATVNADVRPDRATVLRAAPVRCTISGVLASAVGGPVSTGVCVTLPVEVSSAYSADLAAVAYAGPLTTVSIHDDKSAEALARDVDPLRRPRRRWCPVSPGLHVVAIAETLAPQRFITARKLARACHTHSAILAHLRCNMAKSDRVRPETATTPAPFAPRREEVVLNG
jgi:hypothetical protein